MAKNDERPPIGLPLVEPSSSRYFLRVTGMLVACAAAVLALGYGWLRLSSGPCDALYGRALEGLRAEVEFFRESGGALGVGKLEIHELRASAQVAEDSLMACCEQQGTDAARVEACDQHATRIAALPAELATARGDATKAKEVVRTAADRLRGIASDLTDIANRSERAAPASVAAGPPSGARSSD